MTMPPHHLTHISSHSLLAGGAVALHLINVPQAASTIDAKQNNVTF
jgi:hypothetical protein